MRDPVWSAQDATEDCKYPIAGDVKRDLPDEHNRNCWEVELYKMVGMMRCVLWVCSRPRPAASDTQSLLKLTRCARHLP